MSKQSSTNRVFLSMILRLIHRCILTSLFSVLIGALSFAQTSLPVGSTMPSGNVRMEDVSGRSLSLNDNTKENGLVVIFLSNTCPWVLRFQDRILELSAFVDENNIGFIALNPNEGYRERGDNLEEMIKHADKAGYDFPYVLDKNHQIADSFGAKRTPEVYVFNADLELVYSGAIDDNTNSASGVENSLTHKAIVAIINGTEVQNSSSRSIGCTIKRGS